jgi:uncharacterized protein DUF6968
MFELGEPLASRTLRFQTNSGRPIDVTVTVGRPVPDPDARYEDWLCPYQLRGVGDGAVRAVFGVDAMQALILALHTLPTELRALVRGGSGTFPDRDEDLGLTPACKMHLA